MLHHLASASSSSSSSPAKYSSTFFNTHPAAAATATSRLTLTVVRAHRSFPADEGSSSGSSDVVEANMSVLKDRIQQLQINERLSLTYPAGHRPPFSRLTREPNSTASSSPSTIIRVNNNFGWNYADGDANMVKSRRRRRKNDVGDVVLQMLKVIGLVSSTVGITCLSGTGLLCLVSLLTHDFSSHQF